STVFFISSRRRHTRFSRDWSSDVCSSDLQKVRTLIRNDFLRAYEEVDAILTPTTPTPAFKRGEKAADPLAMYLSDIYTIGVNLRSEERRVGKECRDGWPSYHSTLTKRTDT